MTAQQATADDLVFAARLMPYRSLDRNGFRVLIGCIALICFTIGAVFFALGLWPVLGFMGLDVLLIYWAFKVNFRDARAYEDVEVSRAHVLVRKVSPKGTERNHRFNQFGTRFQVERHEEIGITKMQVANREQAVEIGYFLNPPDRESFAEAFTHALARAKR